MFHFPSFASHDYVFIMRYLPYGKWVSPFRNLRITGYLPPPRSLSQAITSFFASDCQGIHHMHLITWLYNPKQSLIPTRRIKTDHVNLITSSSCSLSVHLSTVQLLFNSYTKTLDSVLSLVLISFSINNCLLICLKRVKQLFQLKFILLMILYRLVSK